jgi:hypothetical protein
MDEMIAYIFGKMRVTENALNNVGKVMKTQNAINRKLAIGIMLSGVGLIITACIIQEQNNQIEDLIEEVNKLKKPVECENSTCCDTESEN